MKILALVFSIAARVAWAGGGGFLSGGSLPGTGPRLGSDLSFMPGSEISGPDWKVFGSIPVYRHPPANPSDWTYHFVVDGDVDVAPFQISSLQAPHTFTAARINAVAILRPDPHIPIMVSAGPAIFEDNYTLAQPDLKWSLLAVGSYRISSTFVLLGGLSLSYFLDQGSVYPVLGARWDFMPDWRLSVTLPAQARVDYRISSRAEVSFFGGAAGARYRMGNEGDFPGQADILLMRLVQFKAGTGVGYWLTPEWRLGAQAEYLFHRSLAFFDESSSTKISGISVPSSGLVRLELTHLLVGKDQVFPEDF